MFNLDAYPLLVLRASAGAGKTFQLTTRYLDLMLRGESPQHILATTFTRKAAGEVLARVLGSLAGACVDDGERAELGKALGQAGLTRDACITMLRTLVDSLGRVSVGTIDGFFNRAARAMGFELGMPADPRLIDEGSPLARQMRNDAIYAVLAEQADQADGMATLIEMLRRLHHDTAQRSVADAIDTIVKQLNEAYRAYPDRALWSKVQTAGLLTADLLDLAAKDLVAMEPALPTTKAGSPNKTFQKSYAQLVDSVLAGHWDEVFGNSLILRTLEEDPEKRTFARVPIEGDWYAALKPIAFHVAALELKSVSEQTLATYDLLALFDAHYTSIRFGQRVLLFSDLTNLLADGLPGMGPAGVDALCYRLDARVTHLLLDEFQDTSLRQWAVLKPFAEQIVMEPGGRSLFCVGDTKQAIYGWRGGCAELFDEVQQMGVATQTLFKSWRSARVVLDTVNLVFEALTDNAALAECGRAAGDWQDAFVPHEPAQTELPGHVVMHTTATDAVASSSGGEVEEDDEAAPPDAHADYVARYIKKLTEDHPGKEIGVLMRSRVSARRLVFALRSNSVHTAEEGGNPIDNAPAVSAVLSAIQLADHPGDRVACFHAANSPMGAVIGLEPGHTEAQASVAARRIRRALLDRGYASVIAEWTQRLASSCDERSLRRLVQLVELAERYDETDAGLRPGFFVEAARAERVDDPSPAKVRVMTIHAAKGLEFDIVVLPELDATLSTHDKSDLIVLHRDSPIAPVQAVYRRQSSSVAALVPELLEAHEQKAYENRTEDLCLLYVALTRARQALHLLVKPLKQQTKKDKDGNKVPTGKPTGTGLTNLSYAAILRQALCEQPGSEGFEGDERLFERGDAGWAGKPGAVEAAIPAEPQAAPPIELASPGPGSARSWLQATPSAMHDAGSVDVRDLLRISDAGGRGYGTAMHALFEQVGFIDEGAPSDEQLASALRRAGRDGLDSDALLHAFRKALEQAAVRDLLSRGGADTLWRERGFAVRLGERLVSGSFDRVHLWREGGRFIRALLIDFKTDRVDDATLDDAVARYKDQIAMYRAALSAMLGIDEGAVATKLCFVGDGRVLDI